MVRFLATVLTAAASTVGASSADELQFLVMGDWGGQRSSPYTTAAEVNTAKGMDQVAAQLGAKFALVLGDNFYNTGVKSVDDSRFQETFEQCFSGDALSVDSGFKFHVVAGNHDHRGNVQAQIDYSAKSSRWSFPSYYYTFTETAPDGATVQIVLIDTVQLFGNSQINDEDTEFLLGSELPGPENLTAAASQLHWIKSTLASSTADYLIVGGHYPVYSIAEHGPTKQLQPDAFPYLRDSKVSAYLCGHEHSEQAIDVGDGIQYHVIGSAHEGDSSTAHAGTLAHGQLKFHSATQGGFAIISASKAGMTIKHVDASGKVLYAAPTIAPRGTSPTPAPPAPPAPSPTRSWDCHASHKISIGKDTNLKKTGDDISSCEDECLSTTDCKAVLWHKTDSHCHVFTGSFSHDDFVSGLEPDSDRDSCFYVAGSSVVV